MLALGIDLFKLPKMSTDSPNPSNGAEIAKIVFDTQEQGNADILIGATMAQIPALKAAFNHAVVRVVDIARELGLDEKQTHTLHRVYALGACTAVLALSE